MRTTDTIIRGQCFLCCRDSGLKQGTDSKGHKVYICRHCGGMNSPERVERSRNIYGVVIAEYGLITAPAHDVES